MSSAEDDPHEPGASKPRRATKKRRVALACDMCRKRKIRCDGKQPSGKCTNCTTYSWECSFFDATKKFPRAYVEALEARVKRHEELLRRLHPGKDFMTEVGRRVTRENWNKEAPLFGDPDPDAPSAFARPAPLDNTAATQVFIESAQSPCDPDGAPRNIFSAKGLYDFDPSDDEINPKLKDLTSRFETLQVGGFHGKSSGAVLIKTMLDTKREVSTDNLMPVSFQDVQRSVFWSLLPWERRTYEACRPHYTFPEPGLLNHLIDAYFTHSNLHMPVLHRPTLEAGIARGQHVADESFGGVVLLVCAIGARFSPDPRVLVPGTDSAHSAGWTWFAQVRFAGKLMVSAARLHDLQITCLAAIYMLGASAAHASWNMIGVGIRLAQDIGAHRKRAYGSKPTAEDELFKRCFWVLVYLERWISATAGRPCAIQEEDFDLEMPVDCDDEYWTHPDPEQAFKQPPGKPSRITAFICHLRLCQILGYSLRSIYASNKAKAHFGFSGEQWEHRTITAFDSILNKWVDSVPDHLRWDPTREDEAFFLQSAHLYATFYDLQITIHRPFITPNKASPYALPSVAICANAARSCSRIVELVHKRWPTGLFPFLTRYAFTSMIVILLGVWDAKKRKLSSNFERELADVKKCLRFVEAVENRWHPAGRGVDFMRMLVSTTELAFLRPMMSSTELSIVGDPESRKRTHDLVDIPSPSGSGTTPGSTAAGTHSTLSSRRSSQSLFTDRAIAGSSRVHIAHEKHPAHGHSFCGGTDAPDALPLRTSELGQMDASDPLNWDMGGAFSFSVPPPHTAATPDMSMNDMPPLDSLFFRGPPLQPDQPPGLSTVDPSGAARGPAGQGAPLGLDVDFAALFGFGSGAQPQSSPPPPPPPLSAPALDSGFGPSAPASIEELLQNMGAAPNGGDPANVHGWFGSDASMNTDDFEWLIPKMFTSQNAAGQEQRESQPP